MEKRSLSIIDVGHGNSAILKNEHSVIVIDAGPKSYLLELLNENDIKHIDVVLISHADQDHIEGLLALLSSKISIGSVRLNTDSLKGSALWDDLLYELDSQGHKGKLDFQITLVSDSGEHFSYGDISVEVLGPTKYLAGKGPGSFDRKKRKITTNSISAVIKISYKEKPIALFTGDLDNVGLDDLLRQKTPLNAEYLIYPHHGGATGHADIEKFATELITNVNPSNILFSIGRGRYKTPRPEIISVIRKVLPKTNIMCTQLSEHCTATLTGTPPSYIGKVFSQGNESKKCCTGTVVINFDRGVTVSPSIAEHNSFIRNNTTSAMCV